MDLKRELELQPFLGHAGGLVVSLLASYCVGYKKYTSDNKQRAICVFIMIQILPQIFR
jgi:hypothetical protein